MIVTTINKKQQNPGSKPARAGSFNNLPPLFGKDEAEFRRSSNTAAAPAKKVINNRILAAINDFEVERLG